VKEIVGEHIRYIKTRKTHFKTKHLFEYSTFRKTETSWSTLVNIIFVSYNESTAPRINIPDSKQKMWRICFVRIFIHSLQNFGKLTRSLSSLVRFPKFCNSWIKIRTAHFLWSNLSWCTYSRYWYHNDDYDIW